MAGPAELVADERQESVDLVGRRRPRARAGPAGCRAGVGRAVRFARRRSPRARRRVGRAGVGPSRRTAASAARSIAVRRRSDGPSTGRRRSRRAAASVLVRGHEAAELPGPVEPDEDLAEQSLVAGRLAAGLERLDGDLGHGPGHLGGRERPPVEAFGRDEQTRARDDLRVAGAARQDVERDVGPRPRAGRHRRPRRDQLDESGELVVAVLEPGADEPETRPDAAERRGHERLGPAAVDEEDDPAVARERRLDRRQRPAERGRLPAPRRPDGATGQRLEREDRRRLATEDPGGAPVRQRQPLLVRADRRLAEDEPDPAAPAAPIAPPSPGSQPSDRAADGPATPSTALAVPSTRLRRSRADARLDRAERAALEPLDEAADEADAVLEGEPRVPLPPLAAAGRPDPAALDPERPDPTRDSRSGGSPAGARGGMPGEARPRRAPPAGRPRPARGSPRGRRAGAACGGRAGRRRARRRPRRPGSGRAGSRAPSSASSGIARARSRSSSSSGAVRWSAPPR